MVKNKTINIGIVGLGPISTVRHIPSLLQIEGVKIKGICARSRTQERLELANSIGASFYQDYPRMVKSESLEAVYICSPTVHHREMAELAFERDLHVFCEKPIALDIDSAEAICSAAQRSSRILFLGYNRRYSPTYRKVKQFSEHRKVHILLLEKARSNLVNTSKAAFDEKARKEADIMGTDLLEFGSHFVDLAKWICGDVIKTHFSRSEIEGITACPGNGVAVFEHKSGSTTMMYLTQAGGEPREHSVAISDDSTCETFGGMFEKSSVRITRGDAVEEFHSSDDTVEAGGFVEENREFIAAVQSGDVSPCDSQDIVDTLRLSLEWEGRSKK